VEALMLGNKPSILAVVVATAVTPSLLNLQSVADAPTKLDAARRLTDAAQKLYKRYAELFVAGSAPLDTVYGWSLHLMGAEAYLDRGTANRLVQARSHLARMRSAQRLVLQRTASGGYWLDAYLGGEHYCAEAEIFAAEVKAGPLAWPTTVDAALTRLATARLIYEAWRNQTPYPELFGGRLKNTDVAFYWSRRWLDAQTALGTDRDSLLTAAEDYLKRSRELEKLIKEADKAGKTSADSVCEASYWRSDAEVILSERQPDRTDEQIRRAARARLDAAKIAYDVFSRGHHSIDSVCEWSNRWRKAAMATAGSKEEQRATAQAHLARVRELRKLLEDAYRVGRVPERDLWVADYYLAEAELLLSQEAKK
jgi:hypothetical protein